ncbi:MAG TPA: amidohydrolase family protein [Sphingomicrobium sp.]|nr:amidohydrolase family protein [Sphingomicrobium sp.]
MPLLLSGAPAAPAPNVRTAPVVDYHQHLVSPAFSPIVKLPVRDGAALVRELDAAGIDRAVVLSVAYSFADDRKALPDPDRLTREENDWTSAQVVDNAPRLIGFCSANPLRDAALEELKRCLKLQGMVGIKQHWGNSGVSLRNPAHLARMQQLFALAELLRVPILIHMRSRGGENYGAEDAHLFLDKLMPLAPDVDVIIAHLGGGGGYSQQYDEVMAAFGAAAQRHGKGTKNLYFDVAGVVTEEASAADCALIAKRIRQVDASHILYGSDTLPPGGSIHAGWEIFRSKLPLTSAEFQTIISNRLAFIR